MWLWTRQEAKRIDEQTIQSGISAESLMETAGQKSAQLILSKAARSQEALVLCGPGNNGGDGFVMARELLKAGLKVTVIEAASDKPSNLRFQKRQEFSGRILSVDDFLKQPFASDLWIDALFGIGMTRNLDPQHQKLLALANSSRGMKVSIDTPSGLNVDTGTLLGSVCFRADQTLTIGHPKPGFYLNQGPGHCGKVIALDIGFPETISRREARSVFLLSRALVRKWLPSRSSTDNKTKGGRCLVIAGSPEMPGAALLASKASMRAGSGYVFTSEESVLKFAPETIPWKTKDLSKFQSVLIGPGLGVHPAVSSRISELKETSCPVVIDADALTVAARDRLYPFPSHWIATPHAGELSRFLEVAAAEIESDRVAWAQKAQKVLGGIILLKGFHTVVAYPDLTVIVPTGNVALAKAGSGDVLAGMIVGFLAQGVAPEKAPLLAAYLHGQMADDWLLANKDQLSLSASDLLDSLPHVIHGLRHSR